MAETSAVLIYDQDEPHDPTCVAVLGGDSTQAGRHAGEVARRLGCQLGGPTWETDARLNGGRPYRLYRLVATAEAA